MTLRIEVTSEGQRVVIHLAGRIRAENLGDLEGRIARNGSIVLDLDEVTLVGVEVVRFLSDAEAAGVELRHCPRFVREWIDREREVDRYQSSAGADVAPSPRRRLPGAGRARADAAADQALRISTG